MKRTIPFFNYPALFKTYEQEFVSIFKDVCSRGAYILQKDLLAFEEDIKKFLNVKHAFGVSDGTNSLIIGLRAIGVGPGDEVIVPSHTYIASAASVVLVGATPVLCDIGADHLIDPLSAEQKITNKTKAIMPVHVNGRTCAMDAVMRVADQHGLHVVEDAAQALGSKYKGRNAGTFGSWGSFSFYPAKVLGCFGDGGAVVTNDDDVAEQLALLRDHGRNNDGKVVAWGTNSRLDNLQAAFLHFKIKHYPEEIERRRAIAKRYQEGLGDLASLQLPSAPESSGEHFDIYQNYELAADHRNELKAHLAEHGISTLIQWSGTPVHQFKELGFDESHPATDRFFERCLMLPMNVSLSDDDVDYIIDQVRSFYTHKSQQKVS